MSISDDMWELDDHFKILVKSTKSGTSERLNAKAIKTSWERVCRAFNDMERNEMKTAPVMKAIGTILHEFEVNRGFDEC